MSRFSKKSVISFVLAASLSCTNNLIYADSKRLGDVPFLYDEGSSMTSSDVMEFCHEPHNGPSVSDVTFARQLVDESQTEEDVQMDSLPERQVSPSEVSSEQLSEMQAHEEKSKVDPLPEEQVSLSEVLPEQPSEVQVPEEKLQVDSVLEEQVSEEKPKCIEKKSPIDTVPEGQVSPSEILLEKSSEGQVSPSEALSKQTLEMQDLEEKSKVDPLAEEQASPSEALLEQSSEIRKSEEEIVRKAVEEETAKKTAEEEAEKEKKLIPKYTRLLNVVIFGDDADLNALTKRGICVLGESIENFDVDIGSREAKDFRLSKDGTVFTGTDDYHSRCFAINCKITKKKKYLKVCHYVLYPFKVMRGDNIEDRLKNLWNEIREKNEFCEIQFVPVYDKTSGMDKDEFKEYCQLIGRLCTKMQSVPFLRASGLKVTSARQSIGYISVCGDERDFKCFLDIINGWGKLRIDDMYKYRKVFNGTLDEVEGLRHEDSLTNLQMDVPKDITADKDEKDVVDRSEFEREDTFSMGAAVITSGVSSSICASAKEQPKQEGQPDPEAKSTYTAEELRQSDGHEMEFSEKDFEDDEKAIGYAKMKNGGHDGSRPIISDELFKFLFVREDYGIRRAFETVIGQLLSIEGFDCNKVCGVLQNFQYKPKHKTLFFGWNVYGGYFDLPGFSPGTQYRGNFDDPPIKSKAKNLYEQIVSGKYIKVYNALASAVYMAREAGDDLNKIVCSLKNFYMHPEVHVVTSTKFVFSFDEKK